jgi:hypothetical protein
MRANPEKIQNNVQLVKKIYNISEKVTAYDSSRN